MFNGKMNNILHTQVHDDKIYEPMLQTSYEYTYNCVLQEIN